MCYKPQMKFPVNKLSMFLLLAPYLQSFRKQTGKVTQSQAQKLEKSAQDYGKTLAWRQHLCCFSRFNSALAFRIVYCNTNTHTQNPHKLYISFFVPSPLLLSPVSLWHLQTLLQILLKMLCMAEVPTH